MDTKWKNRKKGISFIIFFAGASLTLAGGIDLAQNLPGDFWRHPDKVLQEDYQQSGRFRDYISGRLEAFLAMATDSYNGYYDNYYDYYDYYGYACPGISGVAEDEVTIITQQPVQDPLDEIQIPSEELGLSDEELEMYYHELDEYYRKEYELNPDQWYDYWYDYRYDYRYDYSWQDREDSLTDRQREENRKELCKKIAQQYHNSIKRDQNLLYLVAYDGQVLYANSELLDTDGGLTAPEGYNFLLQYADGKVRIIKDGNELDVYGDGYYRDNSEWYVPGYRNFTVDEEMKKAVICIAAAQEPVLYTWSSNARGSYQQMDNSLYWMRYNTLANRKWLISCMVILAIGLALLLMAFLCRKSKREADATIARFTGKIWFEGKILLGLLFLYSIFLLWITGFSQNYGDFWYEWEYMTAVDYGYDAAYLGRSVTWMLRSLPGWAYVILFWLAYLAVNDLRRNQKVWKHGLTAKLLRTFGARDLRQPLSVRTARRNVAAFAACAVFGLLMLAGGVIGYIQGCHNAETIWGMGCLFFLILVGFLVLQYRIGAKNMEIARDLETLSNRIRDIRNGNYEESGGFAGNDDFAEDNAEKRLAIGNSKSNENNPLAGHDLEDTMAQLEDIRHGMISAVDEQMKSERMKVELIANVSHDIKTPLTSIISYVQFLKEEKELPEHVRDYVKILDEKSQRLKNMVQDVFAVSKAASGELPMHMEKLDFGKLLRQTLADMEEQIEGSRVTFRTEIPESPVMILADGQRMYRVFQNLFQNAIQYSLDGSRVFVTLQTDGSLAVASVKNTSHLELEKGKDFTERFTRGDQSRTDGGSGLGLSIAQSFTEACGGSFSWETNADLFVVTVSFQILDN